MSKLERVFEWTLGNRTYIVHRCNGLLAFRIDHNDRFVTTHPKTNIWFRMLEGDMERVAAKNQGDAKMNLKYAAALQLWKEIRKL
jgi:hypothetical protein